MIIQERKRKKKKNIYIACLLFLLQFLVYLQNRMSRNRFEAISAFLHVVTAREESANRDHPLCKILSLSNHMKIRELAVDERMVKSKARTHFRQYIRNKPPKWGFKFWVLADPTGYTLDFNVYGGQRGTPRTAHGLSFDVVMELVRPFQHQGYYLFTDNFYTSPALVQTWRK